MDPISVKQPDNQDSWELAVYAKDQPQYRPLPVLKNIDDPNVPVVSVWEPDANERLMLKGMIEDGRPIRISLTQWTFGDNLQPVKLEVGTPIEGMIES